MLRVLQWVALLGLSRVVMRTICRTRLAEICGLRPGRGASFSMLASPCRINRLRHCATVCRITPNSAAIFSSGFRLRPARSFSTVGPSAR